LKNWPNASLTTIEGADHFFWGREGELYEALSEGIRLVFPGP
jgi:alpha/beta superfamily hydrolase